MRNRHASLSAGTAVVVALSAMAARGQAPRPLTELSLEELLKVEFVTAGKKPERASDIPASVVLVQREEIQRMGYQSLAEVLAHIPGLYHTTDYLTDNFGVRGFWSVEGLKHLKILVNGVEQTEALTSYHMPEMVPIPVEVIDRIEVVRGPMSVIYGSGAFFGAINIITNRLEDRPHPSTVAGTLGTAGTGRMCLQLGGEEGRLRYDLITSYATTRGVELAMNEIGYSGSLARIHMRRGEGYANFSGRFGDLSVEMAHSENQHTGLILTPPAGDGTQLHMKSSHITLGYEGQLAPAWRLAGKVTAFDFHWTFDYDYMVDGPAYGTQTNGSSGFAAELNAFYTHPAGFNLTVGLNSTVVTDITTEFSLPAFGPDYVSNNWGLGRGGRMTTQSLFVQGDVQATERIKLVAGARLDRLPDYTVERRRPDLATGAVLVERATYTGDRVEVIPRLAVVLALNPRHHLKCLYGEALTRPSFFQNTDLIWHPGAAMLKPETIRTTELSYTGLPVPELSLSLSAFQNRMDRLIFRTVQVAGAQYSSLHSNVGRMNSHGFELIATVAPGAGDFKLDASCTYQKTQERRDRIEGEIEPGCSPAWVGQLKASYELTERLGVALLGRYVGPMETYYDTNLAQPQRIGERVGGYALLGANLRYTRPVAAGHVSLNLHVTNLLDRTYRYPTTSNVPEFGQKGLLGAGRMITGSVGWQF